MGILRERRESFTHGDRAKLLFDIDTREEGWVVDRGVDRNVGNR